MKNIVFAVFALLTLSANASHTVCSGETLYYSDVRADMGTPPRPGTLIGKTTIVHEGKVLLDHDKIAGLHIHGPAPYYLNLDEPKPADVLENTGNAVFGSTVYRTLATLFEIDPLNPIKHKEIDTKVVVCEETWAMVP